MLLLAALLLLQTSKDVVSSPLREAKKEDWFTRALIYMESNPETLEELMNRNSALLQGDMMLNTDRNAVESTWPTPEIPYVISSDLESRTDDIVSAMSMVSEHTCVSFHTRTSETNYLLFVNSKGCASYVGFIGGEQPVFIGPPCRVGNIVHEILHALGFHHEHTRTDREQHVSILQHNIMDGMERNFQKQQGQTFDLRYDVKSIMHYGSGFFSANGLPTIVAKSDVKGMGQRDRMTETDVQRVRRLYSCDAPKPETEEKEETKSSEVKKEEDINTPLFHDEAFAHRGQVTSAPASPSVSLQLRDAATRGHTDT